VRKVGRGMVCIAAIGCSIVAGVAVAEQEGRAAVRDSMRKIFESMRILLPASVDGEAFRDPAQADELRQALRQLADEAGAVAQHVGKRERGSRYLGRSLQREARQAESLFSQGITESAQFSVLQMAEYCVECHSRSRIPEDSALSKGFVSEETFGQLGPEEKARLQFALREFDAGLDTLDKLFVSDEISGAELLGAITNYLVVSVRLKQDYDRATRALQNVAARPDLWTYLRLDVERWIAALAELRDFSKGKQTTALEQATEILDRSREAIRFPSDRQALVHYVVASELLQRFVESEAKPKDKARAYYLLGLVESRIGRSYWLALPDFYLESAIMLDPAGDSALQAYAMIEEETLFLYSYDEETDRAELPLEVESRLADLRRRIERARGIEIKSPMDSASGP